MTSELGSFESAPKTGRSGGGYRKKSAAALDGQAVTGALIYGWPPLSQRPAEPRYTSRS